MGLLAGIYNKEGEGENLRSIIGELLRVQRHRDMSEPVVVIGDHFAFGMSNHHNAIFCDEEKISDTGAFSRRHDSGSYAFVDGIVLDVLKHR